MDTLRIRGARTHNLKNIDLDIPRNQLVVVTGLSGSGKSSLAFDTLYAEGQRRYVESLSTYARQFLSLMEKPDADLIDGLSPAIAIEQKTTSHNPRSTVGTTTEIYDYLRLLFARAGTPRCPDHGIDLQAQTISQMVDTVLTLDETSRWVLLAPLINERKGEHNRRLAELKRQGFLRVRIDGEVRELDEIGPLDRRRKHQIDIVVDRFRPRPDIALRLAESFETALELSDGLAIIAPLENDSTQSERLFSSRFSCPYCDFSIPELEPRALSFNNPAGACSNCDGLGVESAIDPARIVSAPDLGLADGAIAGWDRRNPYFAQMIDSLARHYDFDPSAPFASLSERTRAQVLYGSGDESIEFTYLNAKGDTTHRHHSFEGIVHNIERRYRQTESRTVRDELAAYFSEQPCSACKGSRLNRAARHISLLDTTLPDLGALAIGALRHWIDTLTLPGHRGEILAQLRGEIAQRLQFLVDVGLDYLTLDRSASTLSGGETQRIRLARQIGAGLVGVLYVLDEPSIGLHQRDNDRLLGTLRTLRDLGNSLIVVEHDEDAIRCADHIIDMGPAAGIHGGEIIAQGRLDDITACARSITGQYLIGQRSIAVPRTRHTAQSAIRIQGARGHNLAEIDVDIPLGIMTCVTGVSGSGKSTLVNDTLYRHAARELNGARVEPAALTSIHGLEQIDKVINIDQSPIGRTPRSNPATYTGLFTPIRELYAATKEARSRGYGPGRFSFNVKGGRCEACQGDGLIKVEMHFLPDIYVPCDVCNGHRYNRETLEIRYKGKSIDEALSMTVEEAQAFFAAVPNIVRKLDTLAAVGLTYIKLGQSATTLSGGEAQRIKLSRELAKRDTGATLYVLDEPTTGLHFHDIEQLLGVLHTLRDRGNTIVVIEHNLDVIKTADWIIDLGPEGGAGGGRVVASGTPEAVAACKASDTGRFLQRLLAVDSSAKPSRARRRRSHHAG